MTVVRSVVQPVVKSVVGSVFGDLTPLQQVQALFTENSADGLIHDTTLASANKVARDGTGLNVTDGSSLGRMLDLSGNDRHSSAPTDAARATWDLVSGVGWATYDGTDDGYEVGAKLTAQEYDIYVGINTTDTSFLLFMGDTGRYVAVSSSSSSSLPYATSGTPTHHVNNTEISPNTRTGLNTALNGVGNAVLNIKSADFSDGSDWPDFQISRFTGLFFAGLLNRLVVIPTSVISGDSTAHAKCYNFIATPIGVTTI